MDSDTPSIVSLHRILKENGLTHKQRAYKRKANARFLKKKLKSFQKWQLDTKYLTDIPNMIPHIANGTAPRYEYTLRDMATGTTFLGYGFKERSLNDTLSFLTLTLYHMQLHGIDTHYVTIQSDNGSENLGHIDKRDRYRIEELVEDKFGGTFMTIPVRRPTYNSHVESFHRRVEPEAYDLIGNISTINAFTTYMQEFILNWNTRRRAMKFKKTPRQIARNGGFLLENCFYNFPILIFDKIQLSLSGTYLPLKSNLMNYLCLHNLRKLVSATKGNILFCNCYNNMFS